MSGVLQPLIASKSGSPEERVRDALQIVEALVVYRPGEPVAPFALPPDRRALHRGTMDEQIELVEMDLAAASSFDVGGRWR